jgi:hypothetical protein
LFRPISHRGPLARQSSNMDICIFALSPTLLFLLCLGVTSVQTSRHSRHIRSLDSAKVDPRRTDKLTEPDVACIVSTHNKSSLSHTLLLYVRISTDSYRSSLSISFKWTEPRLEDHGDPNSRDRQKYVTAAQARLVVGNVGCKPEPHLSVALLPFVNTTLSSFLWSSPPSAPSLLKHRTQSW